MWKRSRTLSRQTIQANEASEQEERKSDVAQVAAPPPLTRLNQAGALAPREEHCLFFWPPSTSSCNSLEQRDMEGLRSCLARTLNKLTTLFSSPLCVEMSDLDVIFGDAAASSAQGKKESKRVKLWAYDRVPAQFLERVPISKVSGKELWKAVEAGTAKAAFLHELAASDNTGGSSRIGIGLSRVAEAMQNAIARLNSDKMELFMNPEILQKAKEEAKLLAPHLEVLNRGKAASENSGSVASLKRKRQENVKPAPSEKDVEASAAVFYKFTSQDASALLGVFNMLSGDGDRYVAYCHLKTAQAWAQHGGGSPLGEKERERAVKRKRTVGVTKKKEEEDEEDKTCINSF